jgi:hypothetical protein
VTQLAFELDLEPPAETWPERLPASVPASRLIPLIRTWLAADDTRSLLVLAHATGVGVDTLRRLMRRQTTVTRFGTADRIVTYLNPWYWHMSPPGLGDLYGSPLVVKGKEGFTKRLAKRASA